MTANEHDAVLEWLDAKYTKAPDLRRKSVTGELYLVRQAELTAEDTDDRDCPHRMRS